MSNKEETNIKKNHRFLKFIIIFILVITSIILYSRFIATKGLDTKEYKITNSIITDNFHGFKIAHLSDIHYGRTTDKIDLERIVKEVNLLKPDLVLITGDLIDKDSVLNEGDDNDIIECLSNINASVGKYAISGNHDLYFDNWESIVTNSGFKNLNDSYELIYNDGYSPILLSGLSSNLESQSSIQERFGTIEEYLSTDELNNIYKILLIHEPDFIDNINYSKFNLVLSGHSHNGQIRLPFIESVILPNGAKKYSDEYYRLGETDLYISSGIGTSRISFRLFNKPSINFYRLTNK